ncbi:hypothetical protein Tco_1236721 [Tanacetum coccineum]
MGTVLRILLLKELSADESRSIWGKREDDSGRSELTKMTGNLSYTMNFELLHQNKGENQLRIILTLRVRFIQPNNDPLALVIVLQQKRYCRSLSIITCRFTHSIRTKVTIFKINNQLRASSNARSKAMVQDGKVVVQDVRGRYNAANQGRPFQRNNARRNGVAEIRTQEQRRHD